MELDASQLAPRDAYALMTGLIVPRPIAWVSTLGDNGHVNLAPFSYFNAVASDPPILTIAIATRRDGTDKDTLRLMKETGVFCVHLVEEHDLGRMNDTSAELPPDVSEATHYGVATTPCAAIAGVRIAGCRVAWECKVLDVHVYGRHGQVSLVVGEVVHVYIDDSLLDDIGRPDPARVQAVSRMGGVNYATLGKRVGLPRPEIERPDAKPAEKINEP